jgi:hypothetical protein
MRVSLDKTQTLHHDFRSDADVQEHPESFAVCSAKDEMPIETMLETVN